MLTLFLLTEQLLQICPENRPILQLPALPAAAQVGELQGGWIGLDHAQLRINHQHRIEQSIQQEVTGHRQQVKQPYANDQPGKRHQGKGKTEGRRVEAKEHPAKHHVTDIGNPGHRRDEDKRQVMTAMHAITDDGRTQHHAHAEGHKQVDVGGGSVEQRSVLIANRRAWLIAQWRRTRAVEQAVPGVAQGHQPDQHRHHGQPQGATQRQWLTHAVDVLPEENGPEGGHHQNARPGHGGPEHFALWALRSHFQAGGNHPPEARQVQHDKALAPWEIALPRDPAGQQEHPDAHQTGENDRGAERPARITAGIHRVGSAERSS